jgi:hypothetical protein
MNKWMFIFCKCNYHSFILYLPYASLHHILLDLCKYLMIQNSLWQMVHTRTFKDPILDIPESSAEHGRGQAPHGNAPPPPPRLPVSLEQLLATQNDLMRLLGEWDASWGWTPAASTSREGFIIFGLFVNSPANLYWYDWPLSGGQLALHDGVQVQATSLYGVLENSERCATTVRLSWSLVGFLHYRPTC